MDALACAERNVFYLATGAVGGLVARGHEGAFAVAEKTAGVYSLQTPVQLD